MPEKDNEKTSRKKTVFLFILIGLLLVEVQIFAIAVTKSGRQATLQVLNSQGEILYESDGARISSFDKYYVEKNFGPLDQFTTRLDVRTEPFPFLGWLFAAVGLPIGAILLIAFVHQAVTQLFLKKKKTTRESPERTGGDNMDRLEERIAGMNIFVLGGLVFVAVFALWAVPNALTYVGQTGLRLISEYKWVFVAFFAVLVVLLVWIIYLRFLLAKKSMDIQADIQKHRMELELTQQARPQVEIEYLEPEKLPPGDDSGNTKV